MRSNQLEELFSVPFLISSVLRSEESEGMKSVTINFWLGVKSLSLAQLLKYTENFLNQQRWMLVCVTEPRVAHSAEEQLAGWTVFSVNKWPEGQKHKHHKLAWLQWHGPSVSAACILRVAEDEELKSTSCLHCDDLLSALKYNSLNER